MYPCTLVFCSQVYPYAANFTQADELSTVDKHDFRGTASFVQHIKDQPSVLIPPLLLKDCEEKDQAVNNSSLAGLQGITASGLHAVQS